MGASCTLKEAVLLDANNITPISGQWKATILGVHLRYLVDSVRSCMLEYWVTREALQGAPNKLGCSWRAADFRPFKFTMPTAVKLSVTVGRETNIADNFCL